MCSISKTMRSWEIWCLLVEKLWYLPIKIFSGNQIPRNFQERIMGAGTALWPQSVRRPHQQQISNFASLASELERKINKKSDFWRSDRFYSESEPSVLSLKLISKCACHSPTYLLYPEINFRIRKLWNRRIFRKIRKFSSGFFMVISGFL